MIVLSVVALVKPALLEKWALRPSDFVKGKYYQIVTSAFVHASWFHLIINALTFYFVAFGMEDDMVQQSAMRVSAGKSSFAWGHIQFLLIWIVSMLASDIPVILRRRKEPDYSTVGSSGAVSGLVTAFMLLKPSWMLGSLPGWAFALFYIAYSLIGLRRKGSFINHSAHLWGALAGGLMMLAFYPERLGNIAEQVRSYF